VSIAALAADPPSTHATPAATHAALPTHATHATLPTNAAAPAAGAAPRTALVVFLTPGPSSSRKAEDDAIERELQSIPTLSLGILSSTQGTYTPERMALDIDRAAHIVRSAGSPARRLAVAHLAGAPGYAQLRSLVATRSPSELIVVVQPPRTARGHELLWSAVAGIGGGHALTSQTTEQSGMIAAEDLAPTLLGYLRLPVPTTMRGKPIRLDGGLDGAGMRSLKARLEVVYPRRLGALASLLAAWALLLSTTGLALRSAAKRGAKARARARGNLAWALRCGALATLWAPVAVLLPAALEPGRAVEYALILATSFALGALTDALLPWPRAPVAPAVAAMVALSVDALAGTQLLMRSLLGPNPAYGSRFYGIGNELKSGLAVLVFAALAACLYPATRSRRSATAMVGAGALLACVEGPARIGAGVGGVMLVCAGTAVATVMLLPGRVNRRRALAALAAPVLGLALLALVDLATAHGAGHFTGSVLDARSAGDVEDLIERRYGAAWGELRNGLMPFATASALLLCAVAIRRRERLLAPVDCDPGWLAALAGGLTAGIVGALVEDSGPVLFVVASSALACVLAYLCGRPLTPRSPDTPPATRSRALTRSAGPAS